MNQVEIVALSEKQLETRKEECANPEIYAKREDLCLPPHTRYAGSLFHQSKLRPYPPDQPWPNRLNLHPTNTKGNTQLTRRHRFLCSEIPHTWRKYSCLSHQEEQWAGFCLLRLKKLWRYVCKNQNNVFWLLLKSNLTPKVGAREVRKLIVWRQKSLLRLL